MQNEKDIHHLPLTCVLSANLYDLTGKLVVSLPTINTDGTIFVEIPSVVPSNIYHLQAEFSDGSNASYKLFIH